MTCKIGDACRCVSEPQLCPNWEEAMTTDDELLALAKRCIRTDGSAIPIVTDPRAIIALIERRRAEVGKMWSASEEHRRDARHWEEKADTLSRNLAAEQRESSKLRAEVERLTRERDETLAAVRATMSRLMDERDAAESALAAAQKRVGELQGTVAFFASVIKSGEPWTQTCEDALRAALKESGNGDETVRPDQQVKDG